MIIPRPLQYVKMEIGPAVLAETLIDNIPEVQFSVFAADIQGIVMSIAFLIRVHDTIIGHVADKFHRDDHFFLGIKIAQRSVYEPNYLKMPFFVARSISNSLMKGSVWCWLLLCWH